MKLTLEQQENLLPNYIAPDDWHSHPSLSNTESKWLHGVDYLVLDMIHGREKARSCRRVTAQVEAILPSKNDAERAYIAGRVLYEIRLTRNCR